MAGEEYIRAAVDNLRKAIAAKQNEISELRKDINNDDTSKRQRLEQINNSLRMANAEVNDSNRSPQERALKAKQIHDLEAEKSHIEQDTARMRQMHEQEIRLKEAQWRDMERKATDLQHVTS